MKLETLASQATNTYHTSPTRQRFSPCCLLRCLLPEKENTKAQVISSSSLAVFNWSVWKWSSEETQSCPKPQKDSLPGVSLHPAMVLWRLCASEANWDATRHCLSPCSAQIIMHGTPSCGLEERQGFREPRNQSLYWAVATLSIEAAFARFHGLIPFHSQYGTLSSPCSSSSFSLSCTCPVFLLPCGLAWYHISPPELRGRDTETALCRVAVLQQQRGHVQTGFLLLGGLWDFFYTGAEAKK